MSCWFVSILFLAGVILSNEPTPIESRQFSNEKIKSAGAFGAGVSGSSEKNRTSTTTISYTTVSEAITLSPVDVTTVTTTDSNIVYGKSI